MIPLPCQQRDSPNHQLNEVGKRKIAKITTNIFGEELSSRIPPNNHQNTYINAEKVPPKEGVISPLLSIFVAKLSPGLRAKRLISEFIAVETAVPNVALFGGFPAIPHVCGLNLE